MFNILNKQTLNAFPYPWLLSTIQLGAGVVWMAVMWGTGLQAVPKVSKDFLKALAPVALFHTVGHVSTCVAISSMAVSFTHVVKSSEPVFSVVMSTLLMRESYSPWVWLSLVPIVLGCSLSAMKEVSLGLGGVTGAMTSNVAFVLRNIFSKREMEKLKDVDGINFYGVISIISMLYLAPVALVVEGSKWSAGWAAALGSGFTPFDLVKLIGASGLFYHLYNQSSFMCLDAGISPVSFSVANSMKRVVVIVSSIIFFRNFVAPLNWAGMAMACVGAYLYTVAKRRNDA